MKLKDQLVYDLVLAVARLLIVLDDEKRADRRERRRRRRGRNGNGKQNN